MLASIIRRLPHAALLMTTVAFVSFAVPPRLRMNRAAATH
jgi:hypothetical protein